MKNPSNQTYLGPCCPVCNVPWSAHPNTLCGLYRPPGMLAELSAVKVDRREIEAARERFKARQAEWDAEEAAREARCIVPWWKRREFLGEILQSIDGWRTGQPSNIGA